MTSRVSKSLCSCSCSCSCFCDSEVQWKCLLCRGVAAAAEGGGEGGGGGKWRPQSNRIETRPPSFPLQYLKGNRTHKHTNEMSIAFNLCRLSEKRERGNDDDIRRMSVIYLFLSFFLSFLFHCMWLFHLFARPHQQSPQGRRMLLPQPPRVCECVSCTATTQKLQHTNKQMRTQFLLLCCLCLQRQQQ